MIFNRLKISILMVCIFHYFFYFSCNQARSETKFSAEELPSIIIAYNFYVAHYNDFKCLWNKGEGTPFFAKLNEAFGQIDCDINNRMGFTHLSFISQSDTPGHFSGDANLKDQNKKANKQNESVLYVTTPIAAFGNKILIILSSISPERTTIIAVDNLLNATLLYDTIKKDLKDIPICSISSVDVINPGVFNLIERGSGRCIPENSTRNIIIDITSGTFLLKMKPIKDIH